MLKKIESISNFVKKTKNSNRNDRKKAIASFSIRKKKIENYFKSVNALNDVQAAINNWNVNKKNKKFDNDRFRMNKTNIECYNYHEKNHISRHCFKSKQKNSKKNKNRSM